MDRAWKAAWAGVDRVQAKIIRPALTTLCRVPAGTWTSRPAATPLCSPFRIVLPFAGRKDEDLVDVRVRLLADLASTRDPHHDDLAVRGPSREPRESRHCSSLAR